MLAVAVFLFQESADAKEGELHLNIKIVRLSMAHVIGMGIIGAGQRVHVNLKNAVAVQILVILERLGRSDWSAFCKSPACFSDPNE